MPLHRRNSTGSGQFEVDNKYLEEITEAELEEDHLHEITCSAPKVGIHHLHDQVQF